MKKMLTIFGYSLLVIAGIMVLFFMGLRVISPGKITPLVKENGNPYMNGIALMEMKEINGIKQSLIIRSKDTDKPVLLYVHGGPGSPEFPFIQYFKSDLEKFFTVCYWDQRGAGLSYSREIPEETMTLEQFVEDTRAVTEYLIEKFDKEKIFILGHSWGTMLSSYTVNKYPELYQAYFGIGQVADQTRSEEISYYFVLEEAKKRGDRKAVKVLEKIGKPPYSSAEEWIKSMVIERKYVSRYGGAVKEGNFMKMAVSAILNCREYRLKDKLIYMKANNQSLSLLWDNVIKRNLMIEIRSQDIPVYIFQGQHDYQTSYEVAKDYFELLEAPEKKFFTFANSAHSPHFEEMDKFEEIIGELAEEYFSNLQSSITSDRISGSQFIPY